MIKKLLSLFILMIICTTPVLAKDKIKVINDNSGVYVFRIDTKKYGDKIKPYVAPKVTTPKKLYEDCCFDLVVNGGFFDVRNSKSVSNVVIDGKQVSDINDYASLVDTLKKQGRYDKVLSRAELRILENKRHKLKFDIAYHNEPIKKSYTLKHSLQAGPMIAPKMDLAGEGFVIYDDDVVKFDSIDILKRRERTAIGLRGKYLYIVLFTKDYTVDAHEMHDYMVKKLKTKKIIALDGGLSTGLNYRNISIGSMGKFQRKVKSFLVIEK